MIDGNIHLAGPAIHEPHIKWLDKHSNGQDHTRNDQNDGNDPMLNSYDQPGLDVQFS